MHGTVADQLLDRLTAWGIRQVFGYPGDGINGVTGALQRAADRFTFTQVRHEETAAFAAGAYVKYGGGPVGLCLATSGPGAVHLLNGLYDARSDHQPVVAIIGQQPRSALGSSFYQEIDLAALFSDVSEYVQMIVDPRQLRPVVDRAVRTALARRGVAVVVVPNDVQDLPAAPAGDRHHGVFSSSSAYSPPRIVPADDDLDRAAAVLNAGQRVALLVGQGALGATGEVSAVADRLGAGAAKALLGKAALADNLPWVTGGLGLLGTTASWQLMQHADTLLIVGSNMPYPEFLPDPASARGVQIDIEPARLGQRYPTEVNLAGDAAATLNALLPRLTQHDGTWRDQVAEWTTRWWRELDAQARQPARPLNAQRVFAELSGQLPQDALLACDCGTVTAWYARHLKLKPPMMGSLSGTLLSMGGGLPYALAAKTAYPGRPVIALLGDGAMQMNGLAELVTVAKYWRDWPDPRFVVLVLNNQELSFVSWEQRGTESFPPWPASQQLPDVPYAAYARLLGLHGVRIDDPSAVAGAWEQALAAGRPALVEAVVDPATPILPPHITFDQAKDTTRAVLSGDDDAKGVVRQSLRQVAAAAGAALGRHGTGPGDTAGQPQ